MSLTLSDDPICSWDCGGGVVFHFRAHRTTERTHLRQNAPGFFGVLKARQIYMERLEALREKKEGGVDITEIGQIDTTISAEEVEVMQRFLAKCCVITEGLDGVKNWQDLGIEKRVEWFDLIDEKVLLFMVVRVIAQSREHRATTRVVSPSGGDSG